MPRYRYHTTNTAETHFWQALSDTRIKWGRLQVRKYRRELLDAFLYIAEHHPRMRSPHRAALAEGTDFSLHFAGHRYIAYIPHDRHNVIIAGIFHESMDIPHHLRELQSMTRDEIDALRRDIKRLQTKAH